jgi:hypothetical protein
VTSVTIPSSVTSVGDYAFSACYNLTVVNIPNSVTNIGIWAFDSCSSLGSTIIPNRLSTLAERVFSGCALVNLTIPTASPQLRLGLRRLRTTERRHDPQHRHEHWSMGFCQLREPGQSQHSRFSHQHRRGGVC